MNIQKLNIKYQYNYPQMAVKTNDCQDKHANLKNINELPNAYAPILFKSNKVTKSQTTIYDNIDTFSAYFEKKLQKMLNVTTEKDIDIMVNEIEKTTKADKKTILEVMGRVAQFSSYSQIRNLGKELEDLQISDISTTSNTISLTNAMKYIGVEKSQFFEDGMDNNFISNWNKGFILDDYGLKELQRLKKAGKLNDFLRKNELIMIDGWNIPFNEDFRSQGILDKSASLKDLTATIIQKMEKEKISLDEALNNDFIDKVENILGESPQIHIIKNKNIKSKTSKDIADMLKPVMPDKEQIKKTIEAVHKAKLGNSSNQNKELSMSALLKYFDTMTNVYSAENVANAVKQQYKNIEEIVKKQNKTMDDVVYIIPDKNKSYEAICYQYAKNNNVDTNKFIYADTSQKVKDIDNKIVVVLDDMTCTGASLLGQSFKYKDFIKNNPDNKIIFSTIISTQGAIDGIKETNINENRNDIVTACKITDYSDFEKVLTEREKIIYYKKLKFYEEGMGGTAIAFPYMAPDNNTDNSSVFIDNFLSNTISNKASCKSTVIKLHNQLIFLGNDLKKN